VGLFHLVVPGDMRQVLGMPLDSNVAGYRNDRIGMGFDHGMYSNPLTPGLFLDERVEVWETFVGDRKVRMAVWAFESEGDWPLAAGIHVPDMGDGLGLTIHANCRDRAAVQEALSIFHSLAFE
jgi:hypothetical protein